MKDDEKSLMPQMSMPVERRLFEASAVGEDGVSGVRPSGKYRNNNPRRAGGGDYPGDCASWCRGASDPAGCIDRCETRSSNWRDAN